MPSSIRRLGKLARLSGSELAGLVEAQLALVRAQLHVWRRPIGSFVEVAPSRPVPELDESGRALVERVGLAVERAAENGVFRPACLVRSVALKRLLERRGVAGARLCIGVRRRGPTFAAHAWIEIGELVLGDRRERVAGFEELTSLEVVELR